MHVSLSGWLGADAHESDVVHIPSERTCALLVPKPIAVVSHWTYSGAEAQRGDRDTLSLARSIREGRGPSWHVAIDRTGTVVQSVAFTRGAFHCRGRKAFGTHRAKLVNEVALGFELENMGRLVNVDGKWRPIVNPEAPEHEHTPDPRFEVPPEDVEPMFAILSHGVEHVVRAEGTVPSLAHEVSWWHRYTDAQVVSFERVLRALVAWGAPLTAETCAYGHADLDPSRKVDPGPLWTHGHLPSILRNVFGTTACASVP